MPDRSPDSIMYGVMRLLEEIDSVAAIIDGVGRKLFEKRSLRMPKLTPAELGFLRTVSWFYVLYYEIGKTDVAFLVEMLPGYDLDPDRKYSFHYTTVQRLRTYLQHNIDPSKSHDRTIQDDCGAWLRMRCGTPVPEEDHEWGECLISFLDENIDFLTSLKKCIRLIEKDESRESVISNWEFRKKRYHPPHQFEELIILVANDMGRSNIDAKRLRKRFYDLWIKELNLLKGDYEFEVEGRKLIEHALISETLSVLPITGLDIMKEFNIAPGPEVGRILETAQKIYNVNPCNKTLLLNKLHEEVGS